MSCRETRGGTLTMRLARAFSGLSDSRLQALFHELKREGAGLPAPSAEDWKEWHLRQELLIKNLPGGSAENRTKSTSDLLEALHERIDPATFHAWQRLEVRARQEGAMLSLPIPPNQLYPPGSQVASYDLGADGRPKKVWYASYGSNIYLSRFMSYVDGSTPEGLQSNHPGCRDNGAPMDSRGIVFPGKMHFAGRSSRWGGGGAAYVDADPSARTLGRAYQITIEQFDDIVAQENRKEVGAVTIDAKALIEQGHLVTDPSLSYGTLRHIGDLDGAPVFTLTGSFSTKDSLEQSFEEEVKVDPKKEIKEDEVKKIDIRTRKPNLNYLRTIGRGLNETFGMDSKQQAEYLRGAPGAEEFTKGQLVRILEGPIENRTERVNRLETEYANAQSKLNADIAKARAMEAYGPGLNAEDRATLKTLKDDIKWMTTSVAWMKDESEKARRRMEALDIAKISKDSLTPEGATISEGLARQ